jgi:hypothetical protein
MHFATIIITVVLLLVLLSCASFPFQNGLSGSTTTTTPIALTSTLRKVRCMGEKQLVVGAYS